MAESGPQANNTSVKFRGEGTREMPVVSKAQGRWAHAAAAGDVEGVPKSVGQEFVDSSHGQSLKGLPERKKKKKKKFPAGARGAHKRGLISDRQMAKMR